MVIVGGMICQGDGDILLCAMNSAPVNNKTWLTTDEGEAFEELAEFPGAALFQCAVFIDDDTLMVTGGFGLEGLPLNPAEILHDTTWFLNVADNEWSAGPAMSTARSNHACSLLEDAQGNKQVVITGGFGGWSGEHVNATEIYDVTSGVWSSGMLICFLFSTGSKFPWLCQAKYRSLRI